MKNSGYLILIFVIFTDLFSGVTSKSIPINIFQEIGKGDSPAACKTVQFLVNSNFTVSCASETFPVNITTPDDSKNETILCLALYDYSSKWCSSSSQHFELPNIANATEFDSEVSKFASDSNVDTFCESEKTSGNTTLVPEAELENLYKHASKCTKYCQYFSGKTPKTKKICFALSWLDHNLRIAKKVSPLYATSKNPSGVGDQTAGINVLLAEKNSENPNTGEKTPVVNTAEEENKEQISSTGKGPGSVEISTAKSNSVSKNSKKGQGIVSSTDSGYVPDNIDKKKVSQEKEEVKKSQTKGSTTGMNSKTSDGKVTTEQKAPADEIDTISENTDDQNSEHDDPVVPGPTSDERPAVGAGFSHQDTEDSALKTVQNQPISTTEEESHFISFLLVCSVLFVCFYIAYHNKKKILAMFLEGRRSRNGRGKRRPSTANYRKLDCNLEEAVTSQCNSSVTHVIY